MTVATDRRDRFRRIAFRHRSKPGEYGLRVHTVSVVTSSWSGARTGEGTETKTTTPVLENNGQPPKVKWLSGEDLTVMGLDPGSGMIEIGPITPECSAGGTPLATLIAESISSGDTRHLLIEGPNCPDGGALYRLMTTDAEKAIHFTLRAVPVSANL